MASGLNKVMLIGNLGKDAETRSTKSGTPVTSFTLATSYRYKDSNSGEWKDRTDWHDVVLWRSERVAAYLKKGKKVFVEGRLQTRSWDDQHGNKRQRTEVVCDPSGLMLLGGREGGSEAAGEQGGFSGSSSRADSGPDKRWEPADSGASATSEADRPVQSDSGFSSDPENDDDIPF